MDHWGMIMFRAIAIVGNSMRNSFFLFFLFFQWTMFSSDYSIVFVHIGQALPSYLTDAVVQARLFNKQCSIYLIANRSALAVDDQMMRENDIQVVHCEELAPTEEHLLFQRMSPLDASYREGFWKKASERFFYLDELIYQYHLEHVFHIESDNMLYVDLSTLLSVFKTYPSLAAVFDNDGRCIPSFMYISNAVALKGLITTISTKAQRGLNDMEIVASYKNEHGRTKIDYLPLIMKSYALSHTLISPCGHKAQEPACYYNKIEQFNSIFDGAAIGQYLGGIDPRNGHSAPGFINESCIFNPAKFTYQWILDEQGRKVPFAVFKGEKYRINNLHIHSKNLKAFKS